MLFSLADELYSGMRYGECLKVTTRYVSVTAQLAIASPTHSHLVYPEYSIFILLIDQLYLFTFPACNNSQICDLDYSSSRTNWSRTSPTMPSVGMLSVSGTLRESGGKSLDGFSGAFSHPSLDLAILVSFKLLDSYSLGNLCLSTRGSDQRG